MAKKSKFGSMKRFGVRYGRRNKEKVAALEEEYRFNHLCPHCNYKKLKRLSVGIWTCDKCGIKFAGKAYMTPTKQKVKVEEKKDITASFDELEKQIEEQRVAREEARKAREEAKVAAESAEASGEESEESAEEVEESAEEAVESVEEADEDADLESDTKEVAA